ncbi:imidazole glycerol phosphate synthase subunit HisF [Candidatus Sulfidibacterium hydrothermale]|uniref:imidazole glycerol phosphate synthase subunit HisF n=1 Tax=Candidatus Sulfidibacterium hydrothermale TaxID=2875962 RepID=UPI001F0B57D9|nr:imidazole glycerol phosphate synthase subunit HisF [Candidatus Sulfidibacterium hydrothermale]UBM61940.1 imidazole glycerol phosphate synthase subunit HisF [Candidatus Sulfidibacterium hydrothermale]
MLAKRIIPCLDIKNGRTVKGTNFIRLRDAGDPVELARIYSDQGADELVFLDITATSDKRKTLVSLVEKIAREINIPFTVGGGIGSVEDVKALLRAGADKVSVNSAAVYRPELINELSAKFGNQCIVLAIDANLVGDRWKVFTHGGRKETEKELFAWAEEGQKRGAGEILFTAMTRDGTKDGFEIEANKKLTGMLTIPVIASGGAGKMQHFSEVFLQAGVEAALAASVFHYGEIKIKELKNKLKKDGIVIRI